MAERAVRPEGSWTIVWVFSNVSRAHACAAMCESKLINWMFVVCASELVGCRRGRGIVMGNSCRFSRCSVGRGGEIGARVKLKWWKLKLKL